MAGLMLIGIVLAAWFVAGLAGWRRLSRGIFAMLAGYVCLLIPFVVLINIYSDAVFSPDARGDVHLLVFLLGIGGVGLIGGLVAGRVAKEQPILHAAGLAVFLTAFATISLLVAPEDQPRWTRIVAQAVLIPAVLLGGFLAGRSRAGRGAPAAG
jgi:hypothetical protein